MFSNDTAFLYSDNNGSILSKHLHLFGDSWVVFAFLYFAEGSQ